MKEPTAKLMTKSEAQAALPVLVSVYQHFKAGNHVSADRLGGIIEDLEAYLRSSKYYSDTFAPEKP